MERAISEEDRANPIESSDNQDINADINATQSMDPRSALESRNSDPVDMTSTGKISSFR